MFKKSIIIALLFSFLSVGCFKDGNVSFGPSVDRQYISIALANSVQTYYGASEYRTVNKEWLTEVFWPEWKNDLYADGIRGWRGKFQCNAFAASFVSDLTRRYFVETFHSRNVAESPAVGVVWYFIGGDVTKYHALVVFVDENLELWAFEIQTGKTFKFSEIELRGMTFEYFQ